jgi:hypothetical protein
VRTKWVVMLWDSEGGMEEGRMCAEVGRELRMEGEEDVGGGNCGKKEEKDGIKNIGEAAKQNNCFLILYVK